MALLTENKGPQCCIGNVVMSLSATARSLAITGTQIYNRNASNSTNSRDANNISRGTRNDGNTNSRIAILHSSQPDNSGRRLAEIGPIAEDDFIK